MCRSAPHSHCTARSLYSDPLCNLDLQRRKVCREPSHEYFLEITSAVAECDCDCLTWMCFGVVRKRFILIDAAVVSQGSWLTYSDALLYCHRFLRGKICILANADM